jgi:hypothetical protein
MTIYTDQEVTDVSTDDGVYVDMIGTSPVYLIHQYKIRHTNNHDSMKIKVNLKSSLSPTTSTVYLQAWNVRTAIWDTLAEDNITVANTDFDLIGRIMSNQSDYYDTTVSDINFVQTYDINEITIRVYQYSQNQ